MDMHTSPPISEIDLCRAWTRLPRSQPLITIDGASVDLIHLGSWTNGFGPDFRGAIISFDNGPATHGSVELHRRTRGWTDHRHHLDPRYNDVILHVVGSDDGAETRRSDGKLVPTVVLDIRVSHQATVAVDWSLVGGDVCAATIAAEQPGLIRDMLGRLGDTRMSERSACIEAKLLAETPDAVLYGELLEALGYAANRAVMADLVDRLPWHVMRAIAIAGHSPFHGLLAVFLGVAGFLPLSDQEIAYTGLDPALFQAITASWREQARAWALNPLDPTAWELARQRPANHPIRRLVQAAAILASVELEPTRRLSGLVRDGADLAGALIEFVNHFGALALGRERARAIVTNVLVPFGFALANHSGDRELAELFANLWESLPGAESNERTRRAIRQVSGDIGIKRIGSRIQQGLIHLDQTLCAPRRCYECPIAAEVVSQSTPPGSLLG